MQANTDIITCANVRCGFGQVCVLTNVMVGGVSTVSTKCVCPAGTVLGLDPATSEQKCVASVCNADTCGANEDCVVASSTSNTGGATTATNAAVCVCRPGYFRQDGACVSITIKPCEGELVRDTKTGICVRKCPDGSTPNGNTCPTTVVCVPPMAVSPVGLFATPVCGFYCADLAKTFVLRRELCPCVKTPPTDATIPFVLCECPANQVRDPLTRECKACENNATPVNGRCPTSSTDTCLAPFVLYQGTCQFPCGDGVFAAFRDKCPVACAAPKVIDRFTRECVSPCADGSIPFNGACQEKCDPAVTSLYECCVRSGATNCIKPCVSPQIRVGDQCRDPCPVGQVLSATGECSDKDCPNLGIKDGNNCVWICPDKTKVTQDPVLNPSVCCPAPAKFDPRTRSCRCPNGAPTIDGKCREVCDPDTEANCPCPPPTTRNADTKKCTCSDGTSPRGTPLFALPSLDWLVP